MVRNYSDRPVDPGALARILDIARRGPSAGFAQGQHFIVVTDEGLRRRIAEAAGEPGYVATGFDPWLSRAPIHVVLCTRESDYRARYAEGDKRSAPAVDDWAVPYWHVDAGATLMLMLFGAVNEGLAAGFAGVHSFDGLRELLQIPSDVTLVGVVTIGHPAPDRPSASLGRGRRAADEVVFQNRWGDVETDLHA